MNFWKNLFGIIKRKPINYAIHAFTNEIAVLVIKYILVKQEDRLMFVFQNV